MLTQLLAKFQRKPLPLLSLFIYLVLAGMMAWLRLDLFATSPVNIGYGLPLLFCLWYPDRRLLWGLMGSYAVLAAYKVFVLSPVSHGSDLFYVWGMQMLNMVVIGLAVHLVIDLMARLRTQKAQLEESNQKLLAREEEITRQNEELQSQSAELAQQNEEIQQQAEEVQQQAEELQSQSEEIQLTNSELGKRQAILQSLIDSLRSNDDGRDLPERICHLLIALLGDDASAAVVLEKQGDDLVVLAHSGPLELSTHRWGFDRSFAAVVMGHDRTAFLGDLRLRPDLTGAQAKDGVFRSIMATPLRINGKTAGVVKVYSDRPHEWTAEQFRMIEWVSAQCSLLLDSRRLHGELQRANTDLEREVSTRTAELQDLVNELEHFSYTITHDLRAPLRAMHGFATLLAEECLPLLNDQSRVYLTRISTAAGRMDRLITDALSYSKAVRHEMVMGPMDVNLLLAGMLESYPVFQDPRAHIEVAGNIPLVFGNEAALTQCFSNLLGNAVKFVPAGIKPHVRIYFEKRPGDFVRIWCQDNGIGIPADMQSRVFVMFQRLSKEYEGTGIGLALVKKVVERMGGAVGLESETGQGTRFWIELKTVNPAP